MDEKELEKRFVYHNPSQLKKEKLEEVRMRIHSLAEILVSVCPESRELSLALTNLEQAQFWANASIVRYD